MPYMVQILPRPTVVDANMQPVAGGFVVSISFPSATQHGSGGQMNYINGPGSAVIEVNGQLFANVPLC
jgi:hypothetical protein